LRELVVQSVSLGGEGTMDVVDPCGCINDNHLVSPHGI
jgi:hypothetical protein